MQSQRTAHHLGASMKVFRISGRDFDIVKQVYDTVLNEPQ